MQVLYLGRAPRTNETLPDFREKCRVTRHSRVFRGLTGSQRTPRVLGRHKGSFPTCVNLWLRAMFMVRDILRLDLSVNSVSKPLNRVEKIPNLVAVNSNPRVSLFT